MANVEPIWEAPAAVEATAELQTAQGPAQQPQPEPQPQRRGRRRGRAVLVVGLAVLVLAGGVFGLKVRPWSGATRSAQSGLGAPAASAIPPAADPPAASQSPGISPSAMPPGGMPAGSMPAGAMPPGSMPQGAMPPGAMPAAAMPPAPPGTPGGAAAPNAPAKPPVVTYEAESGANSIHGSAVVAQYDGASGGRVVTNIGNTHASGSPGTLRFDAVNVTSAGRYALTVFAVNPYGGSTEAVISVSGNQPIHLTVAPGAICCVRRTVIVTLNVGLNTVTFSNPHDRAPAIDRIVLAPLP